MTHTTKHTPGPWKAMKKAIQPKDGLFYCMVHEDKEDQSVAPAKGLGLTREEAVANAALIAAAPAMYAESKTLCSLVRAFMNDNRLYDGQLIQAIHNLETALAQAEGKS